MTQHFHDLAAGRTYAVLDIETLFLRDDYACYRRLDPRAAEIRWPFKSVCAAALLTFTIDAEGIFEFGDLDAWAGEDEGDIVRELFSELRMVPDATVVTWGGLNLDLPVLRMAAMRHGLRVPTQLKHNARRNRERCHLDLVAEMRAGGQFFVHLSEIATALKLPCKFGDQASRVPVLLERGKLRRIEDIALADVITTALVLQSHLAAHGDLCLAKAAHILTLREVVRQRPEARFADYLARVEKRLTAEVLREAEEFVTANC